MTTRLDLLVSEVGFTLDCDDSRTVDVLSSCYSALLRPYGCKVNDRVEIRIRTILQEESWTVSIGSSISNCCDLDELLYAVDKALTIELQHQRRDLFFIHGAAVAEGGRCVVISGESGAGKSTLCWQLCCAGLEYMSDELVPVDLGTINAHSYPHALCLKSVAPGVASLPDSAIDAGRTIHVPVSGLKGGVKGGLTAISAFVFLTGDRAAKEAEMRSIGAAEAAARIFANGLNQLAHENSGLGAASGLARAVPSYLLDRGSIDSMSGHVAALLQT